MRYKNYKNLLSVILSICLIIQMSIPLVYAEDNGMQQSSKTITAFDNLAENVKNITVEVDSTEVEAIAKMPSSLNATYVETTTGSALSITLENITWELDEANSDSATFDSSQNGASYTYKAKLPATDSTGDELVLESGVSLPTITVLVGAMPMLLGGSLDEASITEQGGNITTYATIEEAITVAQTVENCTVTLLKDVETENLILINNGTFTLDLNGKWLNNTANDGICAIGLQGAVSLKIKDSVGTGGITTIETYSIYSSGYCSLKIEGGSYKGIMWSYNNVGDALENGYVYRNISDNSLVTDVNTLSNFEIYNVKVTPAPVIITAQPEDTIIAPGYTVDQAPTLTVTAQTVPSDSGQTISYQWYKDDVAIDGATNSSYTVPTGLTEGTYTYYCAVTCEGVLVKSNNAELYIYSNTGDYEVTDSNSNTSKYPELEAAITFAKSKPGSTVKLLADANTVSSVKVSSGTFTIDLNGHIWTSTATDRALDVSLANHITLKDSHGGGKFTTSTAECLVLVSRSSLTIESGIYENTVGTVLYAGAIDNTHKVTIKDGSFIGTATGKRFFEFHGIGVLINNGSFSGNPVYFGTYENITQSVFLAGGTYDRIRMFSGSLGDLLEEDYAFNQSGTWINNPSGTDISNVIVQLKPVAISQQPQNATNATYGYTQGPNISVTAQKTATGTGDISYKWYRVKSGSEPNDMQEGTNSNILEIQPGLPAGTHSFYCVVSCDGYILNTETVTFTVEKATPRVEIVEKNTSGRVFGDTIQIKAKVSGIYFENLAGTITLKEGSTTIATAALSNGSAILEWTNVPSGDHNLIVEYTAPSNSNYTDETSSNISFNVAKAPQASLHINEVTGKKFLDGDFTLSTTGGTGTGAVSYSASSNDVLSISGNTATITGAGTVTVTATKTEDENYLSTSAQTVITIGKASAPTITFPTAREITYGQKLIDSILDGGSISLGSFSWIQSEQDLVPTVNGATNTSKVIFTPNATTVKNYEEISQVDRETDISFTVNKAQPSVNLSTKSTGTSGNRTTEIKINLSKSGFGEYPQGTIKLVDCTGAIEKDIVGAENLTILNGEASYTWTGLSDKVYKVKAVYDGDDNYSSVTSGEISFDTTKKEQENFKVEDIGNKTYGDETFTLMTTGGNGTGTVSFESSDSSVLSIQGNLATIHKAGIVNITAKKAGDNIYNPTEATASFNIAKKTITVKADNKRIKKGSALPKLSYTVKDLVNGDSFTVEPTLTSDVKDTNVIGNYVISISGGTLNNSENYIITYVSGELVVENNSSGGSSGGSTSGGGSSSGGSSGGGGGTPPTPATPQAPIAPEALTKEIEKLSKEQPQSTASPKTAIDSSVFTDIANHWAKDDIAFVTQRGLFGGTAADKFSPNMPMTRGMFVTVLGRLANADVNGLDSSKFADVKTGAYYAPYVEWANKNNIISGTAADKFSPNTPITREQMAAIIANYSKFAGVNPPKLQSDEKGVATRAQVSAVLRRYIEFLESQK